MSKLRVFCHFMPWEIDAALSVSDRIRRSSYFLDVPNQQVQLDFVLNCSSGLIDWDKSQLNKQFFIDKFNVMSSINEWGDMNVYKPRIYEGDKIWGHLDGFRDIVNDDTECDAYCRCSY